MATTYHPFLDALRVHDVALEPEIVALAGPTEPAGPAHAPSSRRRPRYVVPLLSALLVTGVPTVAAAAIYSLVSGNGATRLLPNWASTEKPAAPVSNQLPDDYPGLHPQERQVFYFLRPLDGIATSRKWDSSGCLWDVDAAGNGYPVIGTEGSQACQNPVQAQRPYRARMIGDAYPVVTNATLRIVAIVDPHTGQNLIAARTVPVQTTAPSEASTAVQPVTMLPEGLATPATSTVPSVTTSSSTPARAAATARPTARPYPADRSARPGFAMSGGPDRMVSLSGSQEAMASISGNTPEDDVMVPITGDPTPLRPIKPGEPMAPGRPLSSYQPGGLPSGSPLRP